MPQISGKKVSVRSRPLELEEISFLMEMKE